MKKSSKNLRYGIIGFGRFAEKAIVPAIQAASHSELVAIQKRSLDAAREKAAGLSIPLAFDDARSLVVHPDVDAVFIVSANSCHCPETLLAAEAGKHVIVEKPMAMNCREAEMMIDACRKNGVKLMVGHMVRLSPVVVRIKEIVESGELGRVVLAKADFVYDARLSHRGWLLDRKIAGGGPVFDIGVHCLDTLRFVLQDEVVSVKSELDPRPDLQQTESTALLTLRFSRGSIGSIFCSFSTSIRRSYLEIIGTEGTVAAEGFTHSNCRGVLTVQKGKGDRTSERRKEKISVPDLYREEVTHFSECVRNDREPVLSGLNGLQNQRVLDAVMT